MFRPQTYSGPDSPNGSVSGSCLDHAGNTGVVSLGLSYDSTAPLAYGVPARDPDSNGWYNQPLRVEFERHGRHFGNRLLYRPECVLRPRFRGRFARRRVQRPGGQHERDRDDSRSATTPRPAGRRRPGSAARCERLVQPSLTVDFSGDDATSGVESCSRATYSGPDAATAFVGGSCRDRAGNQGTGSIVVKYDATAPAVTLLVAKAGKRSAKLVWRTTPDTQSSAAHTFTRLER